MKSMIFFAILFFTLSTPVYGQQQLGSRFGALQVAQDENGRTHRLLYNGKAILQPERQSINVFSVLNGKGRDHVIVGIDSGGIACPTLVVIVELYRSGEHRISEEFGSCSDLIKAKLVGGRVIVEMPVYIPHPDLLSKRELKQRQGRKEVYTWYKGKLSKRTFAAVKTAT
jgi:hypothetical protein